MKRADYRKKKLKQMTPEELQKVLDESYARSIITGGLVGGVSGAALGGIPTLIDGGDQHNPYLDAKGKKIPNATTVAAFTTLGGLGGAGVGAALGPLAQFIRKYRAKKLLENTLAPTTKTAGLDTPLRGATAGAVLGGGTGLILNTILGRKLLDWRLLAGGAGAGALLGGLAGKKNRREKDQTKAHLNTLQKSIVWDENGKPIKRYVFDNKRILNPETLDENGHITKDTKLLSYELVDEDNPRSEMKSVIIKGSDIYKDGKTYAGQKASAKNQLRDGYYVMKYPVDILGRFLPGASGKALSGTSIMQDNDAHGDPCIIRDEPWAVEYKLPGSDQVYRLWAQPMNNGQWGMSFGTTELRAGRKEGDNPYDLNAWDGPVGTEVRTRVLEAQGIKLPKDHFQKSYAFQQINHKPIYSDAGLKNPNKRYVFYGRDENGNLDTNKIVFRKEDAYKNGEGDANLSVRSGGSFDILADMVQDDYFSEGNLRKDPNRAYKRMYQVAELSPQQAQNLGGYFVSNKLRKGGVIGPFWFTNGLEWLGMPGNHCMNGTTDEVAIARTLGPEYMPEVSRETLPERLGSEFNSLSFWDAPRDHVFGKRQKGIITPLVKALTEDL